jgi:hypothetical protein
MANQNQNHTHTREYIVFNYEYAIRIDPNPRYSYVERCTVHGDVYAELTGWVVRTNLTRGQIMRQMGIMVSAY